MKLNSFGRVNKLKACKTIYNISILVSEWVVSRPQQIYENQDF